MITRDFWKFNKTTLKVHCKIVSIHYLEVLVCLYFSLGFYINYVVCKLAKEQDRSVNYVMFYINYVVCKYEWERNKLLSSKPVLYYLCGM